MITAVTTSMGRREHLEATLSRMLDTFDRVIVVDWSCPDGSGDYASKEGASVVTKHGETYYNGARAKNWGALNVTTSHIAFVDADSFCMPGLRTAINELLSHDGMILSARNNDGTEVNDTAGFLVCPYHSFKAVGGFDESWIGWGNEDMHLRGKLLLDANLSVSRLPNSSFLLGAIAHSNELRSVNREEPIEKTAITSFKKLVDWYAARGIDYPSDPRVQDIRFNGPRAS